MKIIIKDVGYNRGYVIGPYLQERPGVNADIVLEDGEDQEECTLKALRYMKSITDRFHKEEYPHLYQERVPMSPELIKYNGLDTIGKSIDYKQKEQLEIAIDNALCLEDLAPLKDAIWKAGLTNQYMAKVEQLLNNK